MKCNFCGKNRSEVVVLVANKETDAKICDECITLSLKLLYKDYLQTKNDLLISLCPYHDLGDIDGKCSCGGKNGG